MHCSFFAASSQLDRRSHFSAGFGYTWPHKQLSLCKPLPCICFQVYNVSKTWNSGGKSFDMRALRFVKAKQRTAWKWGVPCRGIPRTQPLSRWRVKTLVLHDWVTDSLRFDMILPSSGGWTALWFNKTSCYHVHHNISLTALRMYWVLDTYGVWLLSNTLVSNLRPQLSVQGLRFHASLKKWIFFCLRVGRCISWSWLDLSEVPGVMSGNHVYCVSTNKYLLWCQ